MPGAQDLNTAPEQTREDGGYILMLQKPGGDVDVNILDLSAIKVSLDLADTALQPTGVGSIVYEDNDAYVRPSDLAIVIASQQATIDLLTTRLNTLEVLIGADIITVLEPGIVDPGVVG